jgi:hypothetical protein
VPALVGRGLARTASWVTERAPLFGSAYMCEEAPVLPSVRVLPPSQRRRLMPRLVRCWSGRAALRLPD